MGLQYLSYPSTLQTFTEVLLPVITHYLVSHLIFVKSYSYCAEHKAKTKRLFQIALSSEIGSLSVVIFAQNFKIVNVQKRLAEKVIFPPLFFQSTP